jgi:hypothetical protein
MLSKEILIKTSCMVCAILTKLLLVHYITRITVKLYKDGGVLFRKNIEGLFFT